MDTNIETSNGSFSSFLRQYQLTIFFVVALAVSIGFALIAVMIADTNITFLTVFTPTLIAIALTALVSGKAGLRELLVKQTIQRVNLRWIVVSLITFPLIAAIAIGFHSLFGGPALALRKTELLPQMIFILLISFGEEYGWRGFALPKLQLKQNALVASLILGLIWGFWHLPSPLIGGGGTPEGMPFYVFMVWIVPATILMTWVYNNTRSVLMAILMHSAANVTFAYLPVTPGGAGQLTTFWLFLGLLWLVTIVVVVLFGPTSLIRKQAAQLETG